VYTTQHGLRFSFLFIALIVSLIFFSVKLVLIQVFRSEHLAQLADKQHNHSIEIEPTRGAIFDRKLRPLALNVTVYSLFANPRLMTKENKEKALAHLPGILGVESAVIKEKLDKKRYFIWLKRKLPKDATEKIKALKIKGLDFINESKRYYPNGSLAAHIIGFAGIDNEGLEGLELVYDKYLKGQSGWAQMIRDARMRDLMLERSYSAPQDGAHIVLTIDETIQYIAEQALEKAFQKHNAKSGSIIVVDVKTGEVLALANRPTYNLETAFQSSPESRTNRIVSFVYEPGSVFKIVPLAAALEEKAFKETDKIFCENGAYRIANHTLHDHHPHGVLTFREVFELSSNIGVAKIAQKLGPDAIYRYAKLFRFGTKTGINLKGEVNGVLKHPKQWSKVTIGAIPMGHEVTVTPLQLVYALAAIANDGVYMKPYVVKYITDSSYQIIKSYEPEMADRIVTPEVAHRMKEILVGVVDVGTAKRAQIEGMRVAGKTGTAQKVVGNQYSHDKFYATFMGFAPADDPRLAAIVVLDEPHPQHFGGTVCAPVFKEVVENALKYLETSDSFISDAELIQESRLR
jgi:cell division protein FtsI/penicillin-binding protein 2